MCVCVNEHEIILAYTKQMGCIIMLSAITNIYTLEKKCRSFFHVNIMDVSAFYEKRFFRHNRNVLSDFCESEVLFMPRPRPMRLLQQLLVISLSVFSQCTQAKIVK